MTEKLILLLAAAAVGLASSWWGGRLGVSRALEQKRAERAFEKRIEWYERTIVALAELSASQRHLAITARLGFSPEILSSNIDAMIAKQQPVSRATAEAAMYATTTALTSLFENSTFSVAGMMTRTDPADPSKGFQLDVGELERSADLLGELIVRLSLEMREQAGYNGPRTPAATGAGKVRR